MTVLSPSRNNAEAGLREVMHACEDPGSHGLPSAAGRGGPASTAATLPPTDSRDDVTDVMDVVPTLEGIRDRIRSFIAEK